MHSSAKRKCILYILWRIFQLFFRCNTRPKKNHINFFSTSCDDRKLHRIKQNMDDLSSYNVLSFLKVWLFTLKCVYIYSIKINWTLWNKTYQCLILYIISFQNMLKKIDGPLCSLYKWTLCMWKLQPGWGKKLHVHVCKNYYIM